MVELTPDEEKEFQLLITKLKNYGISSLTPKEIDRLKYLIDKKYSNIDPDLKYLILVSLGILLGYIIAKND